ncbi:membrane-associated tyrosine- and threonine-specific cdc2-inhibitory kinase [Lepisosteus oculatus]|uniref:membrane-associated tyrosine- and threonine-specific cdc2-inhibitory kinase n=1 Tax=Lepisosteus oculatus TaxID=7918 RepID=UPI00371469CC
MPVPRETQLSSPPLPVPAFFSQAEQSFSLKKRRPQPDSSSSSSSPPPLSRSLPPRPPCKGAPPLSRVFPQRVPSWSHPRPRPVSLALLPPRQLPSSQYNPSSPQSYFQQCFSCLGLLGRGSFGEVFKVLSLDDGRLYAVKRSVQRFRGDSDRQRSLREARNHERLRPHPNILGFRGAWEEAGRLYIRTELCAGSLQGLCERGPLAEPRVWGFLSDLLCALRHLHAQGFLHLDLKPANVFLSPAQRCKLGDFGLLLQLGGQGAEAQEGDPRYMAPELLRGHYSPAADVFSLGLSILELACNMELPQSGEDWQRLRQGHLPTEFTAGLSKELQSVLHMMLNPDPSLRATVPQLLSLPVLKRIRWRRNITLALAEMVLSVTSLCQSMLSVLWGVLSFIPLPHWKDAPPNTPPTGDRQRRRLSGSTELETGSLGEELFTLPMIDPDLSPSQTLSYSGVSTGSPSPPGQCCPAADRQTSRAAQCSVGGGPSREEPSSSQNLLADPGARTTFEPRNLLSLFEEAVSD